MLSLKSLIPASLLAMALPVAAPAYSFDPVFPLMSAIMTPHAPSAMLYRAEFQTQRFPTLQPGVVIGPSIPHLRLRLNCIVQGTPVEFPNDLHIWSNYAVAAGAVAHWSIPDTNYSGSVVLPALAAGQHYFVSNAIPGGLAAGWDCNAHLN